MAVRSHRCLSLLAALAAVAVPYCTAQGDALAASKSPHAAGVGGAVASNNATATRAGLAVLKAGGTAADAAVAVAATLGVTDPYVAGIGGGGYFVFYDARRHRVF